MSTTFSESQVREYNMKGLCYVLWGDQLESWCTQCGCTSKAICLHVTTTSRQSEQGIYNEWK